MIRFADENTKPLVRSMWKEVFGDKDEYMDLIFDCKYKNENTLIYFEDGIAAASLQMFSYDFRFNQAVIPFYYLAGLCTLPAYRNKGYMGQLIRRSFEIMQERAIPLSILVPAEDWLFGYYEKYGFVQTFDKSVESLDMETILSSYRKNPDIAYKEFDSLYQKDDFCVLKTSEDLRIIVEDYVSDGCPLKYNLAAMSRIIDPKFLLEKYAINYPSTNFIIRVTDNQIFGTVVYEICDGIVTISESSTYDFDLNIRELTRLLFGYKIEEFSMKFRSYFSSHIPVINLMLE